MKTCIAALMAIGFLASIVGRAEAACAPSIPVAAASVSTGVAPITPGDPCAEVIRTLQAAPTKMKITSIVPSDAYVDGVIFSLDGKDTYAIVVCGRPA